MKFSNWWVLELAKGFGLTLRTEFVDVGRAGVKPRSTEKINADNDMACLKP